MVVVRDGMKKVVLSIPFLAAPALRRALRRCIRSEEMTAIDFR
jgi:hypothetical protein